MTLDLGPVGRVMSSTELSLADLPTFPSTIWDLMCRRAKETPDRVILADDKGRSVTAAELKRGSLEVAAFLFAQGVTADTRVSWQLPTIHEAALVLMALTRLGAVQNPIIPILRQREVSFIVGQTDAQLLITPSTWRTFDYGNMARNVSAQHGCPSLVIEQGRLPKGDPAALPPKPDGDGDPIRFIYYTSGTTADPKGAKHTDRTVMAAATALILMSDCDEVVPVTYPFTHIGGVAQTIATLYTGSRLVMFEEFDPVRSPLSIAAHGATTLGGTTLSFQAYEEAQRLNGPDPLFSELRYFASGGAPKSPDLFYELKAAFRVPTLSSWGLTEFPMATVAFVGDLDEDLAVTEGRILPSADLKVVASDGTRLGYREEGELLIRGPQLFKGYVDAGLNSEAFDAEGYFRTGDVGAVDSRGHVRITGRIKDVIIRNAENLSALEIENTVNRYPKVADVAVIGVPDRVTGERAVAVVVLVKGTADLSLSELAEHCRSENLANQKIPEQLEIVDALPRNSMGKILKQELRQRLA